MANTMLPCKPPHQRHLHGSPPKGHPAKGDHDDDHHDHERRLLWYERRSLAADSAGAGCKYVSSFC